MQALLNKSWLNLKHYIGGGTAATTYRNNQANYWNLLYTGSIFIGTPLQEFPGVIWDTGSGSLLIESSECSNCDTENPVFQVDSSSSFSYTASPPTAGGVTYLDGTSLLGNWA